MQAASAWLRRHGVAIALVVASAMCVRGLTAISSATHAQASEEAVVSAGGAEASAAVAHLLDPELRYGVIAGLVVALLAGVVGALLLRVPPAPRAPSAARVAQARFGAPMRRAMSPNRPFSTLWYPETISASRPLRSRDAEEAAASELSPNVVLLEDLFGPAMSLEAYFAEIAQLHAERQAVARPQRVAAHIAPPTPPPVDTPRAPERSQERAPERSQKFGSVVAPALAEDSALRPPPPPPRSAKQSSRNFEPPKPSAPAAAGRSDYPSRRRAACQRRRRRALDAEDIGAQGIGAQGIGAQTLDEPALAGTARSPRAESGVQDKSASVANGAAKANGVAGADPTQILEHRVRKLGRTWTEARHRRERRGGGSH